MPKYYPHEFLKSLYYQDLDFKTGTPRVSLTRSWRKSNPFATLFKQLRVTDGRKFYEAVAQIPPAVQERLASGLGVGGYGPGNVPSPENSFVPKEANVLVPFFIDAARSPVREVRTSGLFGICIFNDQRVSDFLVEESKATQPDAIFVRQCIDKYMRFGLMKVRPKSYQIDTMLKQEEVALARARASIGGSDFSLIAESAKSLKQLGDRRGMDLINDFFRRPNLGPLDSLLYEYLGQNLVYENEITPAMLEGLRKIHNGFEARGCQYFDMRWNFMPRRFDARYAEAILISIDARPSGQPSPVGEDYCVEAFKSQLRNADVRQAFFRGVYPGLTTSQKTLADELAKALTR